jgi:hypothetical protein
MTKKELREKLITEVLEQIKMDLADGIEDTIVELLNFCPNKNLVEFLPEDSWELFKEIHNDD